MNLVFGMAADGRSYPEHPERGVGSVGSAVVGPAGLLELLATRLGLSRPIHPPVVRIATWQRKLEAAASTQDRFWSASLAVDPWATARQILSWRDALIESGWKGTTFLGSHPPARLADLAAAEMADPTLPPGRADLLREVIAAVERREASGLERVELIDARTQLAPGWQQLLEALETGGVEVRPVAGFVPVEIGTDLGLLHRFLRTGMRAALKGDHTVAEIEAQTAIMAAECVAEWIGSEDGSGRDTVIIVPDGDSALLDEAFARRGSPTLGLSAASSYRGALQILSLAFSAAWSPVDINHILELLLLPRPPLSRWAAGILASALSKEPGIGGPEWQRAWGRIEEKLHKLARDGATLNVSASVGRWRAWLDVGRFDRKAGMPAQEAVAICQRVLDWAIALDAGRRDPLLLCVVGASRALMMALHALGRSPVSSLQVERMIDHVIAEGLPNPNHIAQEGYIRAVADPGALWNGAGRVVWWNFSGNTAHISSFPWSETELAALSAAGCLPEPPSVGAEREAAHWQRAVLHARTAILFVRPALSRGSEVTSHPFAHSLAPLLRGAPIKLDAERLLTDESVSLAACEIRRTVAPPATLPSPQAVWSLPPALLARIPGRVESATSFEDLLACQMRWVLKHVVGLRGDSSREIPDKERLFGNLAHALAQAVFVAGQIPDPREIRQRAREQIDELVSRIAAPLRMPGLAGELAYARERIPDALATLADLLSRKGLAVEASETEREHAFGDLQVRSRIDLVVRGPGHGCGAIDLKWTNAPSRRRDEIRDGRAIQLATYSRLIEPEGGAPAAYFLLKQRHLVAGTGSALAFDEVQPSRGLDDTWNAIVSDWRTLTNLGRAGQGLAAGVEGVEDHLPPDLAFPSTAGVCTYCNLGRVCRT